MIKTIIFDADGVLINSEKFSDVLRRDYDVDVVKEKEFFTNIFQDCLVGKADLKKSLAPYLPAFGWKGTVDEFLDYWFKSGHSINKEFVFLHTNASQQRCTLRACNKPRKIPHQIYDRSYGL